MSRMEEIIILLPFLFWGRGDGLVFVLREVQNTARIELNAFDAMLDVKQK